jgi:uncharacterized repeat protein (TIGR03806 family)
MATHDPDAPLSCMAALPSWDETDAFPQLLSETGCFSNVSKRVPSRELVPYTVAAPLFSDGAVKRRWLYIPDGAPAFVAANGELSFPVGSVLVKHFELVTEGGGSIPVETRIMLRSSSDWKFVGYLWFADGSDARRNSEFSETTFSLGITEQNWMAPGERGCKTCHSSDHQVLGPEIAQLDTDVCYGEGDVVGQVDSLIDFGLLDRSPEGIYSLVDPNDTTATLERRARSYLHVNCATCHRPGGWTSVGMDMDLRFTSSFRDTQTCKIPVQNGIGSDEARLRLDPGRPGNSFVYTRMYGESLLGKMPAIGLMIDREGATVVGDWISSVEVCPE